MYLSNQRNSEELLLHKAINNGNIKVVRLLINQNVDVNEKEASSGSTPLHLAVRHRRKDIMKLLLEHGARSSINVRDNNGKTPIHVEFDSGRDGKNLDAEIVQILIDAGANVNETSNSYAYSRPNSLLRQAIESNNEKVVEILLLAKPNLNDTMNGETLMATAISSKANSKIIELLVNAGVKVSEWALQQVLEWEDFNPAKILICAGAKVNTKSCSRGQTALHLAAEKNDIKMIQYLLSKGANVNVKDNSGRTPFQRAALSNVGDSHLSVIQLLSKKVNVEDKKDIYYSGHSQTDDVNSKFFQLIFNQLENINKRSNQIEEYVMQRCNGLQKKIEEIENRNRR